MSAIACQTAGPNRLKKFSKIDFFKLNYFSKFDFKNNSQATPGT